MRKRNKKAKKRAKGQSAKKRARQPAYLCEAVVVEGLETIACDELARILGKRVRLHQATTIPGVVRFNYTGNLHALLKLQTVIAVYLVQHLAVPRPRALLGDQHFRALLARIATVRNLLPQDAYKTLYLAAAGSDSSVMTRLKTELAQHTSLVVAPDEGDLLIRVRRPADNREGWETLIRLSPRPLATRSWRVCNLAGALNATVAHAMALHTRPTPQDVFLNVACGSGTLLIERLACAPAKQVIGCDINKESLSCARENIAASGHEEDIALQDWDARALPLPDSCIDALCADLPFGHLVGSHEDNETLYPLLLQEAARVAKPNACFAVISHEVRLMEALLARSDWWTTDQVLRINLGGLHPRIYILRRSAL